MKLSAFKETLRTLDTLGFELPSGQSVPSHYHLTEIGQIDKQFMDCGGKLRQEKAVSLQLWYANDTNHELKPGKMLQIVEMAEEKLALEDAEIEVEYQSEDTIGKYALGFNGKHFVLEGKATACLAMELCCAPMVEVVQENKGGGCTPGGGCC